MNNNETDNSLTIIRALHDEEHPYTAVPNQVTQDFNLSLAAKGLLVYLLSFEETLEVNFKEIANENGVSENKIKKLINELIENGYYVISPHEKKVL